MKRPELQRDYDPLIGRWRIIAPYTRMKRPELQRDYDVISLTGMLNLIFFLEWRDLNYKGITTDSGSLVLGHDGSGMKRPELQRDYDAAATLPLYAAAVREWRDLNYKGITILWRRVF